MMFVIIIYHDSYDSNLYGWLFGEYKNMKDKINMFCRALWYKNWWDPTLQSLCFASHSGAVG